MVSEKKTDSSKELIGPILDAIPGGVFWKDRDGVFLGCNQHCADDAGFGSPSDMIGKTDFDMVWRDHAELYRADDRQVIESGVAKANYEEPHVSQDGRRMWVRTCKVPLRDRDGEIIGILGTYIDITDQRELAARLEEKGRLEAVGRLAGGVAHDFNNLLTAITGAVDLAAKQVSEGASAIENLQTIREAAAKAADLTGQLLAFGRCQVMVPKTIELQTQLTAWTPLLRSLLGERITLTSDIGPDAWAITMDPSHLQRVLVNLTANARDAMPEGGTFTISATNVRLDESVCSSRPDVRPGAYLQLALSDDGIGMSDADRSRAFEPFFTTKAHGTGLGLATSHGLVKQGGGHIWVESMQGAGTTFTLLFPRGREVVGVTETETETETAPNSAVGSGTVLLIEDDAVVRRLSTAGLEQRGFVVHPTASLAESVSVVQALARAGAPVDTVVCDVMLPGTHGPEVVEIVKRHHPACNVLYVSGYTGGSVLQDELLESGAQFLSKPYSLDQLVEAIGKAATTRG